MGWIKAMSLKINSTASRKKRTAPRSKKIFLTLSFMCYALFMRCDTCGKETQEVKRVVVDTGYDRTLAKALYNCPECFEKKELAKKTRKNF